MVKQTGKRELLYSDEFKLNVIGEYLEGGVSKYSLFKKYGISSSSFYQWLRTFVPDYERQSIGAEVMKKEEKDRGNEVERLKKELAKKELELKRAEMRADFYQTMVDVAERMFEIDIKKKVGGSR